MCFLIINCCHSCPQIVLYNSGQKTRWQSDAPMYHRLSQSSAPLVAKAPSLIENETFKIGAAVAKALIALEQFYLPFSMVPGGP